MLKKVLLFVFLAVVVAGGIGAWYTFNKPARKVDNETGIAVSAANLCKEFQANEQTANAKYLDKAVEVTGNVAEVNKNQDSGLAVVLKGDDIAVVQCTMRDKTVAVTVGKDVTIKGILTSSTMLGVVVNDCIIKGK